MNRFLTIISFLLLYFTSGAQIRKSDLAIAEKAINVTEKVSYHYKKNSAYYLFKFYKSFISSQDVPNTCGFYPSCSDYGLGCVQHKGIVKGSMATFDRLTRCNGKQNMDNYEFDSERRKFLDPFK